MDDKITYSKICEAKTPEDMQVLFEALLLEICADHGGSPDKHRKTQMRNVGYFAGYYDPTTMRRVNEWLGAVHPVFGVVTYD
jgi:starvation-inducible outer membrane lipoprotein